MAKMYRTALFMGPLMRISYAHNLFTPRSQEPGKPAKYGCTFIMEKSGDWSTIQAALKECITGQWGAKGPDRWKAGLIKNPVLEGDGKEARNKETGEISVGLGEHVRFIRVQANEDRKPQIVDRNGRPIVNPDALPSGSWGYPGLNAFCWHNDQNGDGISFGIETFLLWKKAEGDEILGGGGRADPGKFFEKIIAQGGGDDGETAGTAADLF